MQKWSWPDHFGSGAHLNTALHIEGILVEES